jgi:hypothetical protein
MKLYKHINYNMQIGICLKMGKKTHTHTYKLFQLFWEKYPYLHSTLKIENVNYI